MTDNNVITNLAVIIFRDGLFRLSPLHGRY